MNSEELVVGSIVHYVSYGTPGGEYRSTCRAAIVTAIHSTRVVDLCVLNPEGLFFNRSVEHSEDDLKGGTWHTLWSTPCESL